MLNKIKNLLYVFALGTFFNISGTLAIASEVLVEGQSRISAETIRAISGLFNNQDHSPSKINQGLKNLIASGLFSEVEIKRSEGKLLIFVNENPKINIIAIEGNKIIDADSILSAIQIKDRDPLDQNKVEESIILIKDLYKRKAYFNTVITAQKIDRGDNLFDLVFEIEEGELSEIERISFFGNEYFSSDELLKIIPSRRKGIFSVLFSSDDFGENVLSRDQEALIKFYKSKGFKDISVAYSKSLYSPVTNDFSISYSIVEGSQYIIGDIEIASELQNVSKIKVIDLLELREGDILNENLILEKLKNIDNYIKSTTSIFAEASLSYIQREDGAVVDLKIVISEKQKRFVERIEINGNLTTTDRVLRREFTFSELDPFVSSEIFKTRENLLSLGFFSKVDLLAKPGSDPNKQIIVVNVEEKPTGSLMFGLSYSTDNNVGGQVSLNERNFLGKGQRLSFSVRAGGVKDKYSFGFTEPEFLGRDVSASIDLSYQEGTPKQNSSVTKSSSISPSLSFQITDSARMTFDYKFMDTVASTSVNSSEIIKNEPTSRTSSSIGLGIRMDGRDSIIKPKNGYIFTLNSKFSGIGGNREYSKITGKGRYYLPLFSDNVVFLSEIEMGSLSMNSGTSTSDERFYLGGRTLRGFQYGGVGPRDISVDESLGGTDFTVGRAEVSFPLGLPKELNMYGGVFGELGKVWGLDAAIPNGTAVSLDDSIRSSVGFSLYWSTPIGPLQFNWAYPQDYVSGVDKLERFSLNLSTLF